MGEAKLGSGRVSEKEKTGYDPLEDLGESLERKLWRSHFFHHSTSSQVDMLGLRDKSVKGLRDSSVNFEAEKSTGSPNE